MRVQAAETLKKVDEEKSKGNDANARRLYTDFMNLNVRDNQRITPACKAVMRSIMSESVFMNPKKTKQAYAVMETEQYCPDFEAFNAQNHVVRSMKSRRMT